jgi:hypothetical protein
MQTDARFARFEMVRPQATRLALAERWDIRRADDISFCGGARVDEVGSVDQVRRIDRSA